MRSHFTGAGRGRVRCHLTDRRTGSSVWEPLPVKCLRGLVAGEGVEMVADAVGFGGAVLGDVELQCPAP